jgi:hypothetical protein
VQRFIESTAWPPAGLMVGLPLIAGIFVATLCPLLSPYQPAAADRAITDTLDAQFRAIHERMAVELQFDVESERRRISELPEYAAVSDPDFVSRRMQREGDSAEAFVPFTVDLLIGAFRKA